MRSVMIIPKNSLTVTEGKNPKTCIDGNKTNSMWNNKNSENSNLEPLGSNVNNHGNVKTIHHSQETQSPENEPSNEYLSPSLSRRNNSNCRNNHSQVSDGNGYNLAHSYDDHRHLKSEKNTFEFTNGRNITRKPNSPLPVQKPSSYWTSISSSRTRMQGIGLYIAGFMVGCTFQTVLLTTISKTDDCKCFFNGLIRIPTAPSWLSYSDDIDDHYRFVPKRPSRMAVAFYGLNDDKLTVDDDMYNSNTSEMFGSDMIEQMKESEEMNTEIDSLAEMSSSDTTDMNSTNSSDTKTISEDEDDGQLHSNVFPDSMKHLFFGMGRISREAFTTAFDMGVGIDKGFEQNNDVLILYGSEHALPNSQKLKQEQQQQQEKREKKLSGANYTGSAKSPDDIVPLHNTVDEALENCNVMKIVLTSPKPMNYDKNNRNQKPPSFEQQQHKQCIAIMGQWDSYHIQKWEQQKRTAESVRMPVKPSASVQLSQQSSSSNKSTESTMTNSSSTTSRKLTERKNDIIISNNDNDEQGSSVETEPIPVRFRPVNVHHNANPPNKNLTHASNAALKIYLDVYEEVQQRLRPIAEIASQNNTRPIIVMVSNYGQLSYFQNFYCSVHSRKIVKDLSNVILFATDQETYDLAYNSMHHVSGLNVFYDESVFGAIPATAATDYHDINYGKIMMSKVYCVHLINSLGYDLLFQDLDLVWYKNPLHYFHHRIYNKKEDFDIYLQYDGPHHPIRFQPLSGNTGFYYVRHNERTEYFFSVFIRMGDLVLADKSHQAAFTTLANEQISLRGLRVKVLSRDSSYFLSGYNYHTKASSIAFRHVVIQSNGKTTDGFLSHKLLPYIFHANWLPNSSKQPVLKDTNNWFLKDQCLNSIEELKHPKSKPIIAKFRAKWKNRLMNNFTDCCLDQPMPRS